MLSLSSSSHYRSSKTSEGASSASEAPTAATVRVEEDRNFALDNFLAGIEAGMTSTQVGLSLKSDFDYFLTHISPKESKKYRVFMTQLDCSHENSIFYDSFGNKGVVKSLDLMT